MFSIFSYGFFKILRKSIFYLYYIYLYVLLIILCVFFWFVFVFLFVCTKCVCMKMSHFFTIFKLFICAHENHTSTYEFAKSEAVKELNKRTIKRKRKIE